MGFSARLSFMSSPVRNAPAVAEHRRALRISSDLTQTYRRMYKPMAAYVKPEKLIHILNKAKVKFVLMGAHGISGWRYEPRATQDVDVLIRKSHHAKAMKAVKKAFPNLTVQDLPAVTRFLDPLDGKPVIDLMKPEEDLYQEVFKNPVKVGKTHYVPNLEIAIACKYAAMISPHRNAEKKLSDAADFTSMAAHNYDDISQDILVSLGEMAKNGGGPEILKWVEDAKAGRIIPLQG
jgi:hypothetical protein